MTFVSKFKRWSRLGYRSELKIHNFLTFFCAAALIVGCDGTYSGEGCFVAGTLVATPSGSVAIEALKAGQEALAYDELAGKIVVAPIDKIKVEVADQTLLFQLENGLSFEVTADHPLYDSLKGVWRPAGQWQVGESFFGNSAENTGVSLGIRAVTSLRKAAPISVYDLQIRRYQNAFIGGVLAHFYWPSGAKR